VVLLMHYGSLLCFICIVNKADLVHSFLSMFISFLYMFRATMCPSSGETTVFMLQFVLVILYDCLHRITSTKCRINTVVSPDDGHIVARNMWRKEINILRKIVHQVGFLYKIVQGCMVNRT